MWTIMKLLHYVYLQEALHNSLFAYLFTLLLTFCSIIIFYGHEFFFKSIGIISKVNSIWKQYFVFINLT